MSIQLLLSAYRNFNGTGRAEDRSAMAGLVQEITLDMLSIQKILVPVVLTETSRQVMRQAAWWAHRFGAETILLHVVPPLSYLAGAFERGDEITARDLHAQAVQRAQEDLDRPMPPEFDGIAVTRQLLRGDPATEIVKTARDRNVSVIMMATHGHGVLYRLLLESDTARVLRESHCPVWTGVHLEDAPARDVSIRNILCSVDLTAHSNRTVSFAAELAAAAKAALTLVHITTGVEIWGPGGLHVDAGWKEIIVGEATRMMADLQRQVGTHAEVIIDSGNVPKLLNRAAERVKADVLLIGRSPGRHHLGDNGEGYGIIRESCIPVLSV
jgi:nucleotide-binding universal stress UspA family protein